MFQVYGVPENIKLVESYTVKPMSDNAAIRQGWYFAQDNHDGDVCHVDVIQDIPGETTIKLYGYR